MKKINIAIDGYSACGKSTTARRVATSLDYVFIDSGAMYRAVTLYFLRNHVNTSDARQVKQALDNIDIKFEKGPLSKFRQTYLNGENVESEIRGFKVSSNVSQVSTIKAVREKLVAMQQALGANKGVVMDGRDIGTVVFPHACLKLFMTADIDVRSERRKIELERIGKKLTLDQIKENLLERDRIDTTRKESPLRKAEDAIEIDTSYLTFDDQVKRVIDLANDIIYAH